MKGRNFFIAIMALTPLVSGCGATGEEPRVQSISLCGSIHSTAAGDYFGSAEYEVRLKNTTDFKPLTLRGETELSPSKKECVRVYECGASIDNAKWVEECLDPTKHETEFVQAKLHDDSTVQGRVVNIREGEGVAWYAVVAGPKYVLRNYEVDVDFDQDHPIVRDPGPIAELAARAALKNALARSFKKPVSGAAGIEDGAAQKRVAAMSAESTRETPNNKQRVL